jgi:hypothetical protein
MGLVLFKRTNPFLKDKNYVLILDKVVRDRVPLEIKLKTGLL